MPKACSDRLVLEIACFDVESCVQAQQAGADRIEFCTNYAAGGVTPAWADIRQVRQWVPVPLHVIIRPRGGNFVYTSSEVEQMQQDIAFCKQQGVDGVVLGVLTADNRVDIQTVQELLETARPLSVTFHRAIDACADLDKAMRALIDLGIHRVLTSGGKPSAWDGIDSLKDLQMQFGRQIIVMPGGGIRHSNLPQLMAQTQCREFHSAAIRDALFQEEEVRMLRSCLT